MTAVNLKLETARARLATVKARGFRRSLREDGAIDLASIMVGVLVMGILGGIIAAAVFAVIPWSQDNAAKSALDAVKTAESIQYTMSQGGAGGIGSFQTDEILEGTTNASGKSLIQDSDSLSIQVFGTTTDTATYKALSRSATGKFYVITSANPSTVLGPYADLATANAVGAGGIVTTMTYAANKLN